MSDENHLKATQQTTLGGALRHALKEITDPFVHLVKAPRALWGIYFSYVLEGLVYFGILTILGKYLSENVGLSDLHAGWVYSGLTGGITLAMLFLGGVADKVGVRKALLLSLGVMVVGRFLLGASGSFFPQGLGAGSAMFFAVVAGLFFVVIGYGMYQPAAYAGVKQFTDEKTATMGYAMIYGLMNLGAFFSGILSPPIRQSFGIVSVFWVYVGLTVLAFLSVVFILTKRAVQRDTLTVIDAGERPGKPDTGTDKEQKRTRPLLDARFALYLVGVLAGVGGLAWQTVNAPKTPVSAALGQLEASAKNVSRQLAAAAQPLPKAVAAQDDAGIKAALQPVVPSLDAAGAALTTLADEALPPPAPPAGGSRVEAAWMAVAQHAKGADHVLARVREDPAVLARPHVPDDGTARAREALRTLGLAHMAAAYTYAGPIDAEVVKTLRLRLKDPDEEILPVPDATADALTSALGDAVPANLVWLAGQDRDVAAVVQAAMPGPGALLADILRAEAAWVEAAALHLEQTPAQPLRTLSQERILALAVLYTHDWGGRLAPPAQTQADPLPLVAAAFFGDWFLTEASYVETMRGALDAAMQVPLAARAQDWGLRYGGFVLLALIFLVLFVRNLLGKRPDHPFNDGRFVFFIFVLIPVQTLFAHNWLTLPYYINRAFGGTTVGDNFEFFSNINPILIFFLSPMVAAITARRKVYNMMIWGTLVMALPTFLLTVGPSPAMLLVYILLMSIGEAMWQPRFLQWVAEIAPEGKTGAYMGIAQFPWFLTKVVAGLYSGYFLARYCPVVGPQNTEMLWFIYALIAMVSPVALVLAKRWMEKSVK